MHSDETEPMELLKERLHMPIVHAPATQDICDLLNSMARKRYVYLQVAIHEKPRTISTYILKWITPYRGSLYKVDVYELPYSIYLHSPITFNVTL